MKTPAPSHELLIESSERDCWGSGFADDQQLLDLAVGFEVDGYGYALAAGEGHFVEAEGHASAECVSLRGDSGDCAE